MKQEHTALLPCCQCGNMYEDERETAEELAQLLSKPYYEYVCGDCKEN